MTNETGFTVAAVDGGGAIMKGLAEADRPRHSDQTPAQWVKTNLFNSWYNGVITVVFGLIAVYMAFVFGRFVLINARWEPVKGNLELFLVGRFPREERTRLIVQVLLLSGAGGLFVGYLRHRAQTEAELAGVEAPKTGVRELVGSYWALAVFLVVSLAIGVGLDAFRPWLLVAGCAVAAATGYAVTLKPRRGPQGVALAIAPLVPLGIAAIVLSTVQDLSNGSTYLIAAGAVVVLAVVQYVHRAAFMVSAAALLGVIAFQVLSGTAQLSWVYLTAALLPAAFDIVERRDNTSIAPGVIGTAIFGVGVAFYVLFTGITPLRILVFLIGFGVALTALAAAARRDSGTGMQLGAAAFLGVLTWWVGRLVGLEGISWEEWGGLHLNLVFAAASTALAFPIGLLLALGRRSSLPVMRWLCTAYIELIRGVPLISLLLMAQLFIGFFLSSGNNSLVLTTKALIVITMFSSAYIAEIVRGGLQAVPKGQTEAGQAMGMSPAKITRLLVLPQALRAVIPAMVGQFISLFKDTSLLTIIGVLEFLGVREIVHAQPDFRGFGLVETLVFVAFGFWAFSFTMSRESQRLERRLNVSN